MRLKQHGPSTLGLRPSKTANTAFYLRQQRPPMIVAELHAGPRPSKTANAPSTVPAAASNRVRHISNCGLGSHPRAPYHAAHKWPVGSYHEFGQEEHDKTESSIPPSTQQTLPLDIHLTLCVVSRVLRSPCTPAAHRPCQNPRLYPSNHHHKMRSLVATRRSLQLRRQTRPCRLKC
jgi:hypothetical protein